MEEPTNYEKLEAALKEAPKTWYPALLRVLVTEAYAKEVFLPGGASKICQRIERNLGQQP